MSSFNLTPEQLAALQTRGKTEPWVAQAMAQRQRPQLGPTMVRGAPLAAQPNYGAAKFAAPAFQLPVGSQTPMLAPEMPRQEAAKVYLAQRQAQERRGQMTADRMWASIVEKGANVSQYGPAGQAPIKLSYMPEELRGTAAPGTLGWDLSKLSDDENVLMLRLVHVNSANMSAEERAQAFEALRNEAARRPELKKKYEIMLEEERHRAK